MWETTVPDHWRSDTHLSVAACGQTSFPSPPSPAPPDPPPEVSSQSARRQVPASSPSRLGHLQSARGHLAEGGQQWHVVWLVKYFWYETLTADIEKSYLAASFRKQDGVLELHIEALEFFFLSIDFMFELSWAAGHYRGHKLQGKPRGHVNNLQGEGVRQWSIRCLIINL